MKKLISCLVFFLFRWYIVVDSWLLPPGFQVDLKYLRAGLPPPYLYSSFHRVTTTNMTEAAYGPGNKGPDHPTQRTDYFFFLISFLHSSIPHLFDFCASTFFFIFYSFDLPRMRPCLLSNFSSIFFRKNLMDPCRKIAIKK